MVKETNHPLWQHNYARSSTGSSLSSVTTMSISFSDSDDQEELASQVSQVSLLGSNLDDPPAYEDLFELDADLPDLEVSMDGGITLILSLKHVSLVMEHSSNLHYEPTVVIGHFQESVREADSFGTAISHSSVGSTLHLHDVVKTAHS